MNKLIPILLTLLLCLGSVQAAQVQAGLLGGLRTVADSDFSDVYGSGLWLTPFAAVQLKDKLSLGLAFSLGYTKSDKPIGLLDDPSDFSLSNLELFGRYRFESGKLDPYLKLGLGLTFYSQTIAAVGSDFSENALSVHLAGGAEYALSETFSLIGELGYSILSVEPLDEKVNLGGLSIQIGLGYSFTL